MERLKIILLMGMVCMASFPLLAQKKVPHSFQYQAEANEEGILKEVTQVNHPGTTSIRLYFEEVQLGPNSYLLLEGSDGAQQKLDMEALKNWNNSSAYFNGQRVKVSVYQSAGETIALKLKELQVNDRAGSQQANEARLTAYANARDQNTVELPPYAAAVGRFTDGAEAIGTGWIAANGAIVTHTPAHYVPGADWQEFDHIEFNVPPSNPDGTINHALPKDQYPLNHNRRVVRRINGEKGRDGTVAGSHIEVKKYHGIEKNVAYGSRYTIIEALPNGTGKRPGERIQQYFQVADHPNGPAMEGQMLEIFHYGIVEGSPTNQTLQTRLLEAENPRRYVRNVNDRDIYLAYNHGTGREGFWDAEMYGAPITLQSTNIAAGVHLEGFTDSPSLGFGFRDEVFRQHLSDFFSSDVTYVDQATVLNVASGEIDKPYAIVSAGAQYVADNGTLSIARGNYNESLTIDRPMTLKAPVGSVVIGASGSNTRTIQQHFPSILNVNELSGALGEDDKLVEPGSLLNFPNPFTAHTELHYTLTDNGAVVIKIFDMLGREVHTLLQEEQNEGRYAVNWDGRNSHGQPVPSGLYIIQIKTEKETSSLRILKK